MSFTVDYPRYLEAKRSVDERALNHQVLLELQDFMTKNLDSGRLEMRVLEVGGGIGTMLHRLLMRGTFNRLRIVRYDLIEIKSSNLLAAVEFFEDKFSGDYFKLVVRFPEGLSRADLAANASETSDISRHLLLDSEEEFEIQVQLSMDDLHVFVRLICADAMARDNEERYDVAISAAFMDLVDLKPAIEFLKKSVRWGGGIYMPLNFDGVTHFEPPVPSRPEIASRTEAAFHRLMGMSYAEDYARSTTGRVLMRFLFADPELDKFVTIGSSAWTVQPQNGEYIGEEKYFLRCILQFMEDTVENDDMSRDDREEMHRYFEIRRRQLDTGKLLYLAHNVDYFVIRGCPDSVGPEDLGRASPNVEQTT